MLSRRLFSLVLVFAVITAACGGDEETDTGVDDSGEVAATTTTALPQTTTTATAPETTTTTTTEAPLPAITPVGDGPYGVGTQTITVAADHRGFELIVDVWFPLAAGATADPARYAFVTGDYFDSPQALAAGFDQASDAGPFPMVVYSHGSGGLRFIHSDYTETLASHGYVVVAPDHAGNTAVERVLGNADPSDVIAYNRPLDVTAVIDGALADRFVGPLVDAESIAVTGHSFGGFTTYAVAAGTDNPNGVTPVDPRRRRWR